MDKKIIKDILNCASYFNKVYKSKKKKKEKEKE